MSYKTIFQNSIVAFIGLLIVQVKASELEIPNTFEDGQVTSAAEMNANFEAIKAAVNDNHALMTNILSLINDTSSELTGFVGFTPTAVDVNAGLFAVRQQCHNFVPKSKVCGTNDFYRGFWNQARFSVLEQVRNSEFENAIVLDSGNTSKATSNCFGFEVDTTESPYSPYVNVIDKEGLSSQQACDVPAALACCL